MYALYSKYISMVLGALENSGSKWLTDYEEHDGFHTASVLDPQFKLNWCTQSVCQTLSVAILAKASQFVANPGPWFTDKQPPLKKLHGLFSFLIETVHHLWEYFLHEQMSSNGQHF